MSATVLNRTLALRRGDASRIGEYEVCLADREETFFGHAAHCRG
jgi:hypothetical protein